MNIFIRALCAAAVLQLSVTALTSCYSNAALAAEAEFDIAAAVSAAATKADHDEIADFFEQEAINLDARVEQHQRMKRSYHHSRALKQLELRMRAHCDKLIKDYRSAAKDNREMANIHRQFSEEIGKK